MQDKPDLVTDEPVATGWVRVLLSGDTQAARLLVREARKLLGHVRTVYGVNERIANHQPGGFYFDQRKLPDGSVIEAITNDGHDTVKVYVPPTSSSQEEDKEETTDSPELYMWVGIKSTSANAPWYAPNAIMIEPPSDAQGIITSAQYWEVASIVLEFASDEQPSITSEMPSHFFTFDEAIAYHFAQWAGPDALYPQPLAAGQHSIAIEDYTNLGVFTCSKNGLRCFSVPSYQDGDDPDRWMPYDPLLPPDDQSGGRTYGDRDTGGLDVPERAWDVVFVLDPGEDRQTYPSDPRPHISSSRKLLEDEAGMAAGDDAVLRGDYLMAVQSVGSKRELYSTRGGEVIPIVPHLIRSNNSDYIPYMNWTDSPSLDVAIEVRLGKGAHMRTFNFEAYIEQSHDGAQMVMPFGYDDLNPFGPNFAQSLLAINPRAGTADWSGDAEQVAPILGGGTYPGARDPRRTMFIYIFGDYGTAQVSDEDYPTVAAEALFAVLETATAGMYGASFLNELNAGATAGMTKGAIWRVNAATGAVDALPVISEVDDYAAWYPDWEDEYGTHPSDVHPWFYWYYPYKVEGNNGDYHTVGILLGPDGWEVQNGQTLLRFQT